MFSLPTPIIVPLIDDIAKFLRNFKTRSYFEFPNKLCLTKWEFVEAMSKLMLWNDPHYHTYKLRFGDDVFELYEYDNIPDHYFVGNIYRPLLDKINFEVEIDRIMIYEADDYVDIDYRYLSDTPQSPQFDKIIETKESVYLLKGTSNFNNGGCFIFKVRFTRVCIDDYYSPDGIGFKLLRLENVDNYPIENFIEWTKEERVYKDGLTVNELKLKMKDRILKTYSWNWK